MDIFPDNPTAPGTGFMTNCFYAILNDSTFDPNTGAQSTSAIFGAGPLNGGAANILKYKCTGFEVIFEPTQSSLNNEGLAKSVYWPRPLNISMEDDSTIVIPS